nr:MAG TPA: hypothetical protein [Caudoviricetes sp.]
MSKITEIILKYTTGEANLEETNAALKKEDADLRLDPAKNTLTEEEKQATTVGYYPSQANGWGLLDTGTGSLDKVQAKAGHLVGCDCGEMYALYFIAGKTYRVRGTALTEAE